MADGDVVVFDEPPQFTPPTATIIAARTPATLYDCDCSRRLISPIPDIRACSRFAVGIVDTGSAQDYQRLPAQDAAGARERGTVGTQSPLSGWEARHYGARRWCRTRAVFSGRARHSVRRDAVGRLRAGEKERLIHITQLAWQPGHRPPSRPMTALSAVVSGRCEIHLGGRTRGLRLERSEFCCPQMMLGAPWQDEAQSHTNAC